MKNFWSTILHTSPTTVRPQWRIFEVLVYRKITRWRDHFPPVFTTVSNLLVLPVLKLKCRSSAQQESRSQKNSQHTLETVCKLICLLFIDDDITKALLCPFFYKPTSCWDIIQKKILKIKTYRPPHICNKFGWSSRNFFILALSVQCRF